MCESILLRHPYVDVQGRQTLKLFTHLASTFLVYLTKFRRSETRNFPATYKIKDFPDYILRI